MTREEREAMDLQAYLDGELSAWRRFRVERRLARDPDARRELGTLREMGGLVRETVEESQAATGDVWSAIEGRLAVTPAPTVEGASDAAGRAPLRWGAGLAGVGAALALTLLVFGDPDGGPSEAARVLAPGSVEWLDTGGEATMVLQDDDEATIIWVVSDAAEATRGAIQGTDGRTGHGRA